MYDWSSGSVITNCTFIGNVARIGGGMYSRYANYTVVAQCTFYGNVAELSGGGLYYYYRRNLATVTNSILWGNLPEDVTDTARQPPITDGASQGGHAGLGNIDSDPWFMRTPDPGSDGVGGTEDDDYGDLRLLPGSPCIDTGDPAFVPEPGETDLDGRARVLCDRVDMGAFEFAGDYDCDQRLDLRDVAGLQNCFTGEDADPYGLGCATIDLDGNGSVDLSDLAAFEWILTGP